MGAESKRSGTCLHLNYDREVGSLGALPPLSSIFKDTQTMRKLAARSIAVALLAVVIPGCTSGGQKSFSWASMNPMTYFAKSDSDSQVPKPSDQMGPAVTMGEESSLASTSGAAVAPPSPYSAAQAVAGLAENGSSATPQRGMYDANGYTGSSLPLSSPSTGYDPYASSGYDLPASGTSAYQAPSGGYSVPQSGSAYDANSTAQYALGGSYDIPNGTQGNTASPPVYASPATPYANNAMPNSNPSPYQVPPLPSQGTDSGLAQDPYGNMTPQSYPGAASSVPSSPANAYTDSRYADLGNSRVATLPKKPPTLGDYKSNWPPPYEPGSTNYNPPNVPAYTPPMSGGYVQPATATEPNYSPGSVSRYPSLPSQSAPTTGAATGGSGATGYY